MDPTPGDDDRVRACRRGCHHSLDLASPPSGVEHDATARLAIEQATRCRLVQHTSAAQIIEPLARRSRVHVEDIQFTERRLQCVTHQTRSPGSLGIHWQRRHVDVGDGNTTRQKELVVVAHLVLIENAADEVDRAVPEPRDLSPRYRQNPSRSFKRTRRISATIRPGVKSQVSAVWPVRTR